VGDWRPDDLVITTEPAMARYDGGLFVMLKAGAVGRLVTDRARYFGTWLVSFNGNDYWVKTAVLRRIDVLDALAELGEQSDSDNRS
jgi:hypothetical protein